METKLQSSLCKGIRACGIPKEKCHEIVNTVVKWYDNNGPVWTNQRIKDLRQWYESCLTGKPNPPDWFKHNKEGYPTGIWNWVFNQKTPKALGVLSCNTVFYEEHLSPVQQEKFLKGLKGNQSYLDMRDFDLIYCTLEREKWRLKLPRSMPRIQFPTIFDMNGSVPVQDGQKTVRPNQQLGPALKALQLSWENVPQVTFEFLDEMDLLGYMPESVLFDNNGFIALSNPRHRRIGRVSVIQEPQLKARTVGNPNRVLQKTLDPLKQIYLSVARKLPPDCTHDQESGMHWVQDQLRQGNELAGSDLTSASDLLEIERCLRLVDHVFGFPKINGYQEFEAYFLKVCREPWWCPDMSREVKWEQGTVMGTGPSFGLLTLTNTCAGLWAEMQAVLDGKLPRSTKRGGAFRVIGDDIIMRSEMLPWYNQIVKHLGGEINFSKTLVSNRVAEFAGRVITRDAIHLKAIKYTEPSDNSFMEYMAQLGDQAKFFLRPRQRKVYDFFKSVPGVAVPGPWMQDSYGEPLSLRYQWYLEEVEPVLKTVEPDLVLKDYELMLLTASLDLRATGQPDLVGYDVPTLSDEGYLPSQVTPAFKTNQDPRQANGLTTLEVLGKCLESGEIMPYSIWKSTFHSGLALGKDSSDLTTTAGEVPTIVDNPRRHSGFGLSR